MYSPWTCFAFCSFTLSNFTLAHLSLFPSSSSFIFSLLEPPIVICHCHSLTHIPSSSPTFPTSYFFLIFSSSTSALSPFTFCSSTSFATPTPVVICFLSRVHTFVFYYTFSVCIIFRFLCVSSLSLSLSLSSSLCVLVVRHLCTPPP